MLAITVGQGLDRPVGVYTPINEPHVDTLARVLAELPPNDEEWWSGHLWKDNRRKANAWLATSVIITDIDYEADGSPFNEHREALVEMANEGNLPGTLFHLTPHGARIAFVLDHPYSDRREVLAAAEAVNALVACAIAGTGYKVDVTCTRDLARLFFAPNARAKGVARQADVIVMRREQYSVAQLIADSAPPPAPVSAPTPPPRKLNPLYAQSFEEAAERWISDYRYDYPSKPSRCPVCDDSKSFHQLPDHADRWYCFSTDHVSVGIQGEKGWHGDALDLEAHARGCKPVDVLKADGYLARPAPPAVPQTNAEPAPSPAPTPAPAAFRPWRSRSYLTSVDIIGTNARNVLDGRALEFNEMSGDITIGRRLIHAADVSTIRANIEARFVGGLDKKENEIGLQLSLSDVERAVEQVAHANAYHPVREYLLSLKWDGVERLSSVAEDIIGAKRTEINQVLIRKFFVSAVARAIEPGCKVDTVFVLVGPQGVLKSSFFKALGGEWFVDTPIDISSDSVRAYMTMRKAWILEFAELESLLRARDQNSVKAFLSSQEDSYVPKHARYSVNVKRSGVIVGTWNPEDGFLADPTGERRYWPVETEQEINLRLLREQRDQLWAEATTLYRAWVDQGRDERQCPWWLSPAETKLLDPVHEAHAVRDVWAVPVLEWLHQCDAIDEITVQEILSSALSVPRAQWNDRDSKRVQRILRASGQWKPNPNKAKGKPRTWIRTGVNTGVKKDE